MTAILAIFAALIGAVAGYLGSILIVYPILLALEGGRDINGGLAIGVALGVGPVGAIIGAGLAMGLTIWARRPKPQSGDAQRVAELSQSGSSAALEIAGDTSQTKLPEFEKNRSRHGMQSVVAVAAILALVIGLWFWLFHEPYIEQLPGGTSRPYLVVEIELPENEVEIGSWYTPQLSMSTARTWLSTKEPLKVSRKDGVVTFRGEIPLVYVHPHRHLRLSMRPGVELSYVLPLAARPLHEKAIQPWSTDVHVNNSLDDSVSFKQSDRHRIRTQVIWPKRQ